MKVKATRDYRAWNRADGQQFIAGEEYVLDAVAIAEVESDAPGTLVEVKPAPKPKPAAEPKKRGTPTGAQNRAVSKPKSDR